MDRIIQLLPQLSGPLLDEALEVARSVTEEFKRTLVMAAVVLRLVEVGQGARAMTAAEGIAFVHNRARALARFVEVAPEASPGMEAARAVGDPHWRAAVLARLIPSLPAQMQDQAWQEALAAARMLGDEKAQARLATRAAISLAESGAADRALDVVQALPGSAWQAEGLVELAPHAAAARPDLVLNTARSMPGARWRALCLGAVAPHLPEADRERAWAEAVDAAREIAGERLMVATLASLVPALPRTLQEEVLRDLMQRLDAFENEHRRAEGLASLAADLTGELLPVALAMGRAMEGREARSQALAALAPPLARQGHVQEALRVSTVEVEDRHWRQEALRALSQSLILSGHHEEALGAIEALDYEHWRGAALVLLAAHSPAARVPALVAVARSMEDRRQRALMLAALSPYLPEGPGQGLMAEALALVAGHFDPEERASALAGLAPFLHGALLEVAVAAAEALPGMAYQVQALGALLPHLARGNPEKALEAAHRIQDEGQRAVVLAALLPYAGDPARGEILSEIGDLLQGMHDAEGQLRLLCSLVSSLEGLSPAAVYAAWRSVLRHLARGRRHDLLLGLAGLLPVLTSLGGVELVAEMAEAAREVGRWWP
ncbi:MAG: hypothetical protein EHM56_06650 [Chloroflexi bacterium]|nr:MAG: hypothetical protein EHM56_06650 [Chloroflexota bacterium]